MSDPEWARKTARNFQAFLSEKSQKDRLFLEEQNIRRSSLDDLWSKLREHFISKVDSLNLNMKRQIITVEFLDTLDRFKVRRNEVKTERLEISCNRDTLNVTIAGSIQEKVSLGIAIDKGTGKAFFCTEHGDPHEPEAIAESSIEKLLTYGL